MAELIKAVFFNSGEKFLAGGSASGGREWAWRGVKSKIIKKYSPGLDTLRMPASGHLIGSNQESKKGSMYPRYICP